MLSSRAKFSAISMILLLASIGLSRTVDSSGRYKLQVAAFNDEQSAQIFLTWLKDAGERPVFERVQIPGRGTWIRILIGPFTSTSDARSHGEALVKRGLIDTFLVKRGPIIASGEKQAAPAPGRKTQALVDPASFTGRLRQPAENLTSPASFDISLSREDLIQPLSITMPVHPKALPLTDSAGISLLDAPSIDPSFTPRPDPVVLALTLVAPGGSSHSTRRNGKGGLWTSGDVREILARLRWIVGDRDAHLLGIDERGQVLIDDLLLAAYAGVTDRNIQIAPLLIADYLFSNEGLLLLMQICRSDHRYRLHIGSNAPTAGIDVPISGSLNLDNNFDSRINPYRNSGAKLDNERPPAGFDSLIALNPIAQWFNMRTRRVVPASHITFHELAEAYAKVDLGLEYLSEGSLPGAHSLAIEREKRLKSQRPTGNVVLTVGSNRLLRSKEEIQRFYAQKGLFLEGQR